MIVPQGWYSLSASVSRVIVGSSADPTVVGWLDTGISGQGAKPVVVQREAKR